MWSPRQQPHGFCTSVGSLHRREPGALPAWVAAGTCCGLDSDPVSPARTKSSPGVSLPPCGPHSAQHTLHPLGQDHPSGEPTLCSQEVLKEKKRGATPVRTKSAPDVLSGHLGWEGLACLHGNRESATWSLRAASRPLLVRGSHSPGGSLNTHHLQCRHRAGLLEGRVWTVLAGPKGKTGSQGACGWGQAHSLWL